MGAWLQEAPVASTPIFFLVGEKVFQSPGAPLSSAESFGSRREAASRETCVLSCPRPGLPTWTESLPLLWMAVPVSLAGQQCLQEVSPLQEAPVKLPSGGPPPSTLGTRSCHLPDLGRGGPHSPGQGGRGSGDPGRRVCPDAHPRPRHSCPPEGRPRPQRTEGWSPSQPWAAFVQWEGTAAHTPAVLQEGLWPRERPTRVSSRPICPEIGIFHAKWGTCGHSTLLQGCPHPKGRARTWGWGGVGPRQSFPLRKDLEGMNCCPPTAGARDWWGQGFGISPREPALDLEQVPFRSLSFPVVTIVVLVPASVS